MSYWDTMYLKIVKETSETRASLDCYDIEYFFNLYEGLTLDDYVDGLLKKDSLMKQEEAAKLRQQKKRLGG